MGHRGSADRLRELSRRLETLKLCGHRYLDAAGAEDLKTWAARHAPSVSAPIEAAAPAPKAPSRRPAAAPSGTKQEQLDAVNAQVRVCVKCPLAKGRTNTVFGVGDPDARIMFIGEGPGAEEDRRGEPFVGRAGQLLTDMIEKGMNLRRADVYIANIVKCRPPGNRDPEPVEVESCEPYLKRQIAIIQPEVICALGRVAAQTLLKTTTPISSLRGEFHTYEGIPLLPTFHPAYLLRNPAMKKEAWNDLKMILRRLGLSGAAGNKEP